MTAPNVMRRNSNSQKHKLLQPNPNIILRPYYQLEHAQECCKVYTNKGCLDGFD